MTPDERRANETTLRGLRAALEHNLPADMKIGIYNAIATLSGEPPPSPEQPPPPQQIWVNATIGGKPLTDNFNNDPFRR